MKRTLLFIFLALGIALCGFLLWQREVEAPTADNTHDNAATTTTNAAKGDQPRVVPDDIAGAVAAMSDRIIVDSPALGAAVHSPVTINGRAVGSWFFEGSFPVVVVDWDGKVIGQGTAKAEGDWMTSDLVPYTATISYATQTDPYSHDGSIILKKDNPSGLPEHDAALEYPVAIY